MTAHQSTYGVRVTVQTMAPGHVIHDADAVQALLIERLPTTVQRLIKVAAPEVFVTVVGVALEEADA